MLENIHWLGHDSFRLDGSVTVYIDPWKLPAGQPAAGLILVTHDHFDHLSLPDIEKIAGPETVVVGPASVTAQIDGPADRHPCVRRERRGAGRAVSWLFPPTTSTSSGRPVSRITRAQPGESATWSRSTACATTTPATPTPCPRCRTSTATSPCCPWAASSR